jgi:phosphate-selective porin OprO and OprP
MTGWRSIIVLLAAAVGAFGQPVEAPAVDPALRAAVEAVLAEKKAAEAGSAIPLQAVWDNQLFFRTPDKDWNIHIGGRVMFESVWFQQPANLRGAAPGNAGVPGATSLANGGVGVLDDGTFFRRVRFKADGTAYGTMEFNLEVNFENINLVTFDHAWMGLKDLPYLNSVRLGQHKVPFGLENWGTDYHLTMIERSSLNEAFSTLFAPGIFTQNTLLDNHVTYQAMLHRIQPLSFYNGADFGPGDYAVSARMTATPVYAKEGASVVHLGGSYQYRTADLGRTVPSGTTPATGSAFGDTTHVARFRSRGDIRDSVGAPASYAGNAGRFVDTGWLVADGVSSYAPEFLVIEGPFSVQSEMTIAKVQNASLLYVNPGRSVGSPMLWGTYTEVSYILTGEHRTYDRRNGTYDRIHVKNNAGRGGWGAWQLAYRYSYLDLNDIGIKGGILQQHTVGVNWYINDNAKLQFNYANIYRDVPAPSGAGAVNGFGLLMQYYF